MAVDFAVATKFTAIDRVSRAFKDMGRASDKFGNKAEKSFLKASRAGNKFKNITKGILAADLIKTGINRLTSFKDEIIETSKKAQGLEVSFQSVFKGRAAAQLKFVADESERLGLQLDTTAEGFLKIAASAKGTSLAGDTVKQVFLGVSEASTALQLSSEQSGGALLALSQIISKGKVQAEELRGQLGERIPGAFQIAARAMKMTTSQLDKFMSSGKLTAEKFLPAFAKQLRKEFGQAAIDASKSFAAAENRFNTVMFRFKTSLGSVLLPIVTKLFTAFAKLIKPLTAYIKANKDIINSNIDKVFNLVAKSIGKIIIGLKIIKNLVTVFKPLIAGLIAYKLALIAAAVAQKTLTAASVAYMLFVKAQIFFALARSIGFASAAMTIFNATILANPIGLIIAGVIAFGVAVFAVVKYWDDIVAAVKETIALTRELFGIERTPETETVSKSVDMFGRSINKAEQGKKPELSTKSGTGEVDFFGRPLVAPNEAEATAKAQNVNFKGQLDITGAPSGSKFENKGKGAPPIDVNMMGAN